MTELELELLDGFIQALKEHAERKAKLYDGIRSNQTLDFNLRLATEELGEIAGAITRNRSELAKYECLDLAHCSFLIYLSLNRGDRSSYS